MRSPDGASPHPTVSSPVTTPPPPQPFLAVRSARDRGQRYETRGVLGTGSYGTVYAVHDRDLDRVVAIKVLDQRWAGDPLEVGAFLDEACSAARIDHASVVIAVEFALRAMC